MPTNKELVTRVLTVWVVALLLKATYMPTMNLWVILPCISVTEYVVEKYMWKNSFLLKFITKLAVYVVLLLLLGLLRYVLFTSFS